MHNSVPAFILLLQNHMLSTYSTEASLVQSYLHSRRIYKALETNGTSWNIAETEGILWNSLDESCVSA